MDIKISVSFNAEDDGVDQTLSLEELDVGEGLCDTLRVMESFLVSMGFTYVETLVAEKSSGGTVTSHDIY